MSFNGVLHAFLVIFPAECLENSDALSSPEKYHSILYGVASALELFFFS